MLQVDLPSRAYCHPCSRLSPAGEGSKHLVGTRADGQTREAFVRENSRHRLELQQESQQLSMQQIAKMPNGARNDSALNFVRSRP